MTANPSVNGQPTQHKCPVCDLPLWARFVEHDEILVWCPHGACPDTRMNDGATAQTLDLAFRILLDLADNKPK